MNEVTRIINAIQQGDGHASEELLPLVYEELRLLAAQKMGQEKSGQTLQATALVHEAYIRLLGSDNQGWDGRGHFFASAAEAMRRILVENARQKKSQKRGGNRHRVEFFETDLPIQVASDELLALDEALNRLSEENHSAFDIVKLYYFTGLTLDQIADVQGISRPTAVKYLAYGHAWLNRDLSLRDDT